MTRMGPAMMGSGEAEGEDRAIRAAEAALFNPLLGDVSVQVLLHDPSSIYIYIVIFATIYIYTCRQQKECS
jgi:hypothetical protein